MIKLYTRDREELGERERETIEQKLRGTHCLCSEITTYNGSRKQIKPMIRNTREN